MTRVVYAGDQDRPLLSRDAGRAVLSDDDKYRAALAAKLAAPGYRPALMSAKDVAAFVGVRVQAVYMWGKREDRTGIRKYPCGRYDMYAVMLWQFERDPKQAARRLRAA